MKWVWRAAEFLAWAAFFAFAGLVLALRYWFLPDIERYRGEIVAAVSRTVGQPVRIGAIEAGWQGLRPKISLADVRIQDAEGREALVLPSIENVLSWRSLLYGELRLHSLAIDAPKLAVRRDPAGALYAAGIRMADEAGGGRFTDWVLSQEEIVIRGAEITWIDEKRGAPPLGLAALNLRLRNWRAEHSIGLSARPPAALGSTLELRAELAGRSVKDPAAWNGRLYAELGSTDLAAWRAWVDYPWQVSAGQGALRLWLTLENGELRAATADVALAAVAARLGKELAPLELASLQGRLQGRALPEGYEFSARGLALEAAHGPSIAPTDIHVSFKPGAGGALRASALELEPLAQLAASLPLPAEPRKLLAELAPRGRLDDARLEWSGPLEAPHRFQARARFAGLAMRPHDALPGFAGLSGSFEASEAKGRLQLAAKKAVLSLPRVLPEPQISLDSLAGQLEWEREGERGVALRLASMSFANEHLAGTASGSYSWPGSGRGIIDLSAHLSRAEGKHIPRYLPHGEIMGQQTRAWLASSIIAGQGSDARLRLKGDLRDFPFDDPARGQFLITARVAKGVLDYAEGWPRISDVDGELKFERDRMDIVGRSGSVLGARLANVRVSIPRLSEPITLLVVSGQAEGPTAEFLKYIAQSPVRRMVSGLTDPMGAEGRGKLRLRLEIPLEEQDKARLAGDYEFLSNSLALHPQIPAVERATGKVSFTESSVTVHDVRGRLFGGAVALSGGSRPAGGIEVVARGDATVAGLQPLFDHPWRRYLSGASPYVATVSIVEGRTRIGFESSLRGVASALPPPLEKPSGDALPLRVEVIPVDGGARERVSVTLGRLAAAEFLRRRQGEAMAVQRAAVWLTPGEPPIRLPERPGTLIYGSLGALDLDRWLPLFSSDEAAASAAAFDLKIGVLDVYGKRMHDVTLRAGADAAGWSATLGAQELAGDVSYRGADGGRLVARLTHFRMPEEYPGAKSDARLTEPKDLPSVDAVAERFTYRGKQLGRVEILANRAGADWRIDKLTMTNSDAVLTAQGTWRGGAPTRTALGFELQTSDAGSFLARIGYPELVKGGKAKMQGALAWNGEPAAIDYASLSGNIQMQAEDGQFLEIEPGFGKLVSLMSLQALPRRITLDFRDVFSKGFQFDRIASEGHVERGVMALKEFKMRGSAAQVDMTGDVDLARETQNLRVRVVPSLGDTASTVIGLVNPLLAIPAAIAQKILKDPLGHIFAFDYSVTGTWSDPKVAKLGIEARPVEPAPEK